MVVSSVFRSGQSVVVVFGSVFRSGQDVIVAVLFGRTSVYPARNRLCVQEWSKCGCGWQDLSVPGRPETDCVFRSGQNVVVAVVSVFRSGQNVVVVIDRTSVYPARDRLCVQEWSKCGCGCACWQRVQEWSKCGCGGWQDLSVPGQKLIRYNSQLAYGNEVYLGCFQDDVRNRHFAYTVPINATTKRLMTPQYCMQQCRSVNQSVRLSVNQSISQSVSQAVSQSVRRSVSLSIN